VSVIDASRQQARTKTAKTTPDAAPIAAPEVPALSAVEPAHRPPTRVATAGTRRKTR
jgi:hypothetical protein